MIFGCVETQAGPADMLVDGECGFLPLATASMTSFCPYARSPATNRPGTDVLILSAPVLIVPRSVMSTFSPHLSRNERS